MNWEVIGTLAEVLGVVAIVISLIYLAIQVQQSNRFARADAEREVLQNWMQGLDNLVVDEAMTATFLRGLADFDGLSSVEKTRMSYKLIELYAVHHTMELMAGKGLLDGALVQQAGNVIFGYILTPGGRLWWKINSPYLPNAEVFHTRLRNEEGVFPSTLESMDYHKL